MKINNEWLKNVINYENDDTIAKILVFLIDMNDLSIDAQILNHFDSDVLSLSDLDQIRHSIKDCDFYQAIEVVKSFLQ